MKAVTTIHPESDAKPRALRAREAAQWLNERLRPTTPFTARMLWRLTSRNQIPTLRISRQCWYLSDQLELWICANGGPARNMRWTDGENDATRGGAK